MAKRVRLLAFAFAGLGLAGFLIWLARGRATPSYQPVRNQPPAAPYRHLSYNFLSPRPFTAGKMWISTVQGTDFHSWLYDIEQRSVVGELQHASPECMTSDGSRILCTTRGGGTARGILRGLLGLIQRLSGAGPRSTGGQDLQDVWVVDVRTSRARRVGQTFEAAGASSRFMPSPDSRYAYNRPTGTYPAPGFFVCDLENQSFTRVPVTGTPQGWWDNRRIIVKNPANDFILYDFTTGQTNVFITASSIAELGRSIGMDDTEVGKMNCLPAWNGRDYDFYLMDPGKRWQATNSCLARLERPGGTLKWIAPQFKFEWSDHFGPSADYYVYSGREPGQGSSAVYFRDLRAGEVRTLVPDDTAKSFSLPNLYGRSVIYYRSNCLWRIDLNGSNNFRLFPPS